MIASKDSHLSKFFRVAGLLALITVCLFLVRDIYSLISLINSGKNCNCEVIQVAERSSKDLDRGVFVKCENLLRKLRLGSFRKTTGDLSDYYSVSDKFVFKVHDSVHFVMFRKNAITYLAGELFFLVFFLFAIFKIVK